MTWPGEKQRHSMSSRGISSTRLPTRGLPQPTAKEELISIIEAGFRASIYDETWDEKMESELKHWGFSEKEIKRILDVVENRMETYAQQTDVEIQIEAEWLADSIIATPWKIEDQFRKHGAKGHEVESNKHYDQFYNELVLELNEDLFNRWDGKYEDWREHAGPSVTFSELLKKAERTLTPQQIEQVVQKAFKETEEDYRKQLPYKIVPQGQGEFETFRLIRQDGLLMKDIFFNRKQDAVNYTEQKGINVTEEDWVE